MSEQKRYTAQEMRDEANRLAEGEKNCTGGESKHISMLRQAADAEEELSELRDQVNRDFGESVSLKARLEAVVKTVKGSTTIHYSDVDAILRAARGEGGKEEAVAAWNRRAVEGEGKC